MSQALERAVEFHHRGELDRAEELYRQVLAENPDHADAVHLLGVVAHQRGQYDRAVQLISRAVRLSPAPVFLCNLAEASRMAGNPAGAAECARAALRAEPLNSDAHNQLGLALQVLGRSGEAAAAFRSSVGCNPGNALAFNNLGGVLKELGRNDDALAAYQESVRLAPNLPLARSNLGQALLENGDKERFGEAEEHCRAAVRLAPDFPEAWSNLGNVLRARNKLTEAKECYERALGWLPDAAVIHGNVGQILQQEGKRDECLRWYRRAVALDPSSARFECFLASALAEKDEFAEAETHYRRAIELDPTYAEAHNGLGEAIQETSDDFDAALRCYEEAIRLKPTLADPYANIGAVHAERGDLGRAVEFYRKAVEVDPDYVGAYGVLVSQFRGAGTDADVRAMERLLGKEGISAWQKSVLHHGLAHAYDARGDYRRAGEHANLGNEIRKTVWLQAGKTYNRAEHAGFVTYLTRQFTPEFFDRVKGWGLDTEVPVFVFGLPRSGTTLLEQILASHPRVHGAGELVLAKRVFDRLPEWTGRPGTDPATCVPFVTREAVRAAGAEHLAALRKLAPAADRVVDKMPDNYLWLGFLAAVFPRAKFVHARRDPHDTAVSLWITNFKQLIWACDAGDVAGRMKDYARIMGHWREVLPVPVLDVDYEQTVDDVEGAARRMIDFCGLEWDPACLAFHENRRLVRTASVTQVRQPVYRRSVRRWKNYEESFKPLFDLLDA